MEPKYLVDLTHVPDFSKTFVTPHDLVYHLLPKIDIKRGGSLKLMEFDSFAIDQPKEGEFCPRVTINMLLLVGDLEDEAIKSSKQLFRKTSFRIEGSNREFVDDCFDFINRSPNEEYYVRCSTLVQLGYLAEFMPINTFGEYSRIRQDELRLCVKAGMKFDMTIFTSDGKFSDSYQYNISGSGVDMSGSDLSELVHLASVDAQAIITARENLASSAD